MSEHYMDDAERVFFVRQVPSCGDPAWSVFFRMRRGPMRPSAMFGIFWAQEEAQTALREHAEFEGWKRIFLE